MGYEVDFRFDREYNPSDINGIRSAVLTKGVIPETATSLAVVPDIQTGYVLISKGEAMMFDGSRIVVDSSGVRLFVMPNVKNYVYLKREAAGDTIVPTISQAEPEADDETVVMLATVDSGGTITNRTDNRSTFKIQKMTESNRGVTTFTDSINANSKLTKSIAIPQGRTKGIATITGGMGSIGIEAKFNTDNLNTRVTGYASDLYYISGAGSAWTRRQMGSITKYKSIGDQVTGSVYIRINELSISGSAIVIEFENTDKTAQALSCTVDWEVE